MNMIWMCHRDVGGYVGQYKKSPRKQQVRYIFSKITIFIILIIKMDIDIVKMIEQAPSKPVRKQKRRQQEGDARLGS